MKFSIVTSKGKLEDTSDYTLLEYRQKLLRVFLLTCVIFTIMITIFNAGEYIENPHSEWGARNLLVDVTLLMVFLLLWWLNKKGFVALAGWILGLLILAIIPESYSITLINQTFLILALPVVLSSFFIQPWASFLFAAVVFTFYSLIYIQSSGAFEYDVFSLSVILILAVGAFQIARLLNKTIQDLVRAYDQTIQGWALALETRDSETMGHSQRVVDLTLQLAKKYGIKDADLVHIRRGVLVHDLGKMAIPDTILNKPGKLTEEEWQVMRRHPEYARQYLAGVSYLAPAIDVPYCHHERWDGTGYPQGLKGEQIPLPARIFAVVDVWDALTSDRPYRKRWSEAESLAYIQEQAGKQFDPQVVRIFTDLIKGQKPSLNNETTE